MPADRQTPGSYPAPALNRTRSLLLSPQQLARLQNPACRHPHPQPPKPLAQPPSPTPTAPTGHPPAPPSVAMLLMKSHESKVAPWISPDTCTAPPLPMVAPLRTRTLEAARKEGEEERRNEEVRARQGEMDGVRSSS